jgi:S-adenosylmethionine synthetase
MNKIKTSEFILSGHPDKVCDIVSDSILDYIIDRDPTARVAIECLIKDDLLIIAGEVTTAINVNYSKIAKEALDYIGYDSDKFTILEKISVQSKDIALGVDVGGAGDQGLMFGYSCNENEHYIPYPIYLSRILCQKLETINTIYPEYYGKDGKCQISINYDDNDIPQYVNTIVVSIQTQKGIERNIYEPYIRRCIEQAIPNQLLVEKTNILINPTGEFVIGGSYADTGLTGRKLQCDSYGGLALHGGGAWSGKDLSKVDRSASYYARWIAKTLVIADLAKETTVGICYAIGKDEPVSITLDTNKTGKYNDDLLLTAIKNTYSFKVKDIINKMSGDYSFRKLAHYGHVGMNDNLPWEKVSKVDINLLIKNTLVELLKNHGQN